MLQISFTFAIAKKKTMRSRIETIMKTENMNQKQFAEVLGLSAGSLSSILSEHTKPTLNHALAVHKVFPEISLNWLIAGEGDMYGIKKEEAPSASTPMQGELDFSTPINDTPVSAKNAVREKVVPVKPARRIMEIRIYFDDGTYETYGGKTDVGK